MKRKYVPAPTVIMNYSLKVIFSKASEVWLIFLLFASAVSSASAMSLDGSIMFKLCVCDPSSSFLFISFEMKNCFSFTEPLSSSSLTSFGADLGFTLVGRLFEENYLGAFQSESSLNEMLSLSRKMLSTYQKEKRKTFEIFTWNIRSRWCQKPHWRRKNRKNCKPHCTSDIIRDDFFLLSYSETKFSGCRIFMRHKKREKLTIKVENLCFSFSISAPATLHWNISLKCCSHTHLSLLVEKKKIKENLSFIKNPGRNL